MCSITGSARSAIIIFQAADVAKNPEQNMIKLVCVSTLEHVLSNSLLFEICNVFHFIFISFHGTMQGVGVTFYMLSSVVMRYDDAKWLLALCVKFARQVVVTMSSGRAFQSTVVRKKKSCEGNGVCTFNS